VECYECGSAHYKCSYAKLIGVNIEGRRCYIYNNARHLANTLPERKPRNGSNQQKPYSEKPRGSGRVFALPSVLPS